MRYYTSSISSYLLCLLVVPSSLVLDLTLCCSAQNTLHRLAAWQQRAGPRSLSAHQCAPGCPHGAAITRRRVSQHKPLWLGGTACTREGRQAGRLVIQAAHLAAQETQGYSFKGRVGSPCCGRRETGAAPSCFYQLCGITLQVSVLSGRTRTRQGGCEVGR